MWIDWKKCDHEHLRKKSQKKKETNQKRKRMIVSTEKRKRTKDRKGKSGNQSRLRRRKETKKKTKNTKSGKDVVYWRHSALSCRNITSHLGHDKKNTSLTKYCRFTTFFKLAYLALLWKEGWGKKKKKKPKKEKNNLFC